MYIKIMNFFFIVYSKCINFSLFLFFMLIEEYLWDMISQSTAPLLMFERSPITSIFWMAFRSDLYNFLHHKIAWPFCDPSRTCYHASWLNEEKWCTGRSLETRFRNNLLIYLYVYRLFRRDLNKSEINYKKSTRIPVVLPTKLRTPCTNIHIIKGFSNIISFSELMQPKTQTGLCLWASPRQGPRIRLCLFAI